METFILLTYIYSLLVKLGYFHDDMSSCKWINLKHKSKFITYRWMYSSKKLIFTFVSCHTRFPLETRRTLSILVSCRIHSFLSHSVNFSSCILPSSHAWLRDLFSFLYLCISWFSFAHSVLRKIASKSWQASWLYSGYWATPVHSLPSLDKKMTWQHCFSWSDLSLTCIWERTTLS